MLEIVCWEDCDVFILLCGSFVDLLGLVWVGFWWELIICFGGEICFELIVFFFLLGLFGMCEMVVWLRCCVVGREDCLGDWVLLWDIWFIDGICGWFFGCIFCLLGIWLEIGGVVILGFCEYIGNFEDSWGFVVEDIVGIVGVFCNGVIECIWLVEDVEFILLCWVLGVDMFEDGVDCEIVDWGGELLGWVDGLFEGFENGILGCKIGFGIVVFGKEDGWVFCVIWGVGLEVFVWRFVWIEGCGVVVFGREFVVLGFVGFGIMVCGVIFIKDCIFGVGVECCNIGVLGCEDGMFFGFSCWELVWDDFLLYCEDETVGGNFGCL